MQKTFKIRVFGRVQGVSFRSFVKWQAEIFGVTGFAKNLSDKTVEAVLSGEEKNLRQLIKKIWRGPALARVDNIVLEEIDSKEKFAGFEIRR